jgi:hypothetical protein
MMPLVVGSFDSFLVLIDRLHSIPAERIYQLIVLSVFDVFVMGEFVEQRTMKLPLLVVCKLCKGHIEALVLVHRDTWESLFKPPSVQTTPLL